MRKPPSLRIQLLMLVQHSNEFLDPSAARLSFFGSLETEINRVTIRAVEYGKKRLCLWILIKFCLKIFWHLCVTLRCVSRVPTPILLGGFNFFMPCWLHPALGDKLGHLCGVYLRPDAFGATRRKFLQKELIIQRALLTIDPAVAQRHIQRFGV